MAITEFKCERIDASYGGIYVGGQLYSILYYDPNVERDRRLCLMNSWTLGCCGARSVFQFDVPRFDFWEQETVEAFFELLDELDREHYYSREVYFLLSNTQIACMQEFIKHPGMRKVDGFTNRGNGGSAMMTLYRWSSSMEDDEEDEE